MSEHLEQAKRWNLFARELEDILASYNLGLGHLDDRDGIHREKVRRLIQSLRAPKSFPVLNTEEMDLLVQTLQLGDEEVLRLRAVEGNIRLVLSDSSKQMRLYNQQMEMLQQQMRELRLQLRNLAAPADK